MREEKDKKIFFKLRSGEMSQEFEAMCFYFSQTQQGMLETCIREYFKITCKGNEGLRKSLEIIKERDEEI